MVDTIIIRVGFKTPSNAYDGTLMAESCFLFLQKVYHKCLAGSKYVSDNLLDQGIRHTFLVYSLLCFYTFP